MKVVVVTGGTQVDWDDMRTITNKSSGQLGMNIAYQYADAGHEVILVSAESVDTSLYDHNNILSEIPFRTYDELYKILIDLRNINFDIIVMAAAVSDYAFSKVDGKISSNSETITVTLHKTTKILSRMSEWYSEFKPFIVGFKLLSGVEPKLLRAAAMKQIEDCNIDMTVANDWNELCLNPELHSCYFATPDGKFIRLDKCKNETARELVEFSMSYRGEEL